MKRMLAITTALLLVLGSLGLTAFAEEPDPISTYVTISDKDGNLAITQEKVLVSDVDDDGVLTINDALYAAHELAYNGGADEGYASSYSDYGLSLDKLWGTANGGSYGYYVNNQSAWSLTDPVEEGDYINAFVYTDLSTFSDTYCYFDAYTAEGKAGEAITLTLSAAGYDADWNPVTLPVAGAVITVNGEKTAYTTDADGKVTLTIADGGQYVISAVSDTTVLVPPVCMATVAAASSQESSTSPSSMTTQPDATTTSKEMVTATDATATTDVTDAPVNGTIAEAPTSPQTGETANTVLVVVLTASFAAMLLFVKRKQAYEK